MRGQYGLLLVKNRKYNLLRQDWNKGNKSPSRIMPSGNSLSPEYFWFKDNKGVMKYLFFRISGPREIVWMEKHSSLENKTNGKQSSVIRVNNYDDLCLWLRELKTKFVLKMLLLVASWSFRHMSFTRCFVWMFCMKG